MQIDLSNYLQASEFARASRRTRQRICRLIRQGRIESVKIGRAVFIPKTELGKFADVQDCTADTPEESV